MRQAKISFIARYPVPASPVRGVALGAELVDSIALLHDIDWVEVEPPWWRRICRYTSYVTCTERVEKGLRVAVLVDRPPAVSLSGVDLAYEMDTRRGTVLHIGPAARLGAGR